MSKRKEARNTMLYDLHLAEPGLNNVDLAEKMLPWGKLSRERVRAILKAEGKRRALAAQIK